MSVQNLERRIEDNIITSPEIFRHYEIYENKEQQLIIRLFKRFFLRTIEKKYGHLKSNATDKIEISGHSLCQELELNPKVIHFCGVITTFGEDAMVNWVTFLKIISIFLLRKDVVHLRLEFLICFFNLKNKGPKCIDNHQYIEERLLNFRFSNRKNLAAPKNVQVFWDRIRSILNKNRDYVFDITENNKDVEQRAFDVLM